MKERKSQYSIWAPIIRNKLKKQEEKKGDKLTKDEKSKIIKKEKRKCRVRAGVVAVAAALGFAAGYSNTKLLLDENKNIISNIDNSQVYLSDISFSSNDFILNTLLTSLPKNLCIHLNTEEDNFIKFLKLIFNGRYSLCNHCNICSNYLSIGSSRFQ